jgi:Domain of unknown function (DUF4173)
MSRDSRIGIALVGSAVVLGVLGDTLFQGQPLGLNVLLWAGAFVLLLTALLRLARAPLHQGRRFMVAPLLLFSALFLWHDSPLLVAANLLALAAAVTMGALRRTRPRLRSATLSDYGGGVLAAASALLAGTAPLLMTDIRWRDVAGRVRCERTVAVARGIAIGLPLLLLFGGLFVAADAVFENLVSSAIPTVAPSTVERAVIVVVWTWLAGGLLRDLLAAKEDRRLLRADALAGRKPRVRVGAVEACVALCALDLLFLAFVVVQFRYLFGGRALVEARTQLTYADYARHGFFELVAVAALTLSLLLLGDWLLRADARGRRSFRALALVLLGLLFVVIASALKRMRLYEEQYGLTELRLYASGVIVWIGVVSVWFALTVLRGHRHAFAVGALVTGFAATLALNMLNPGTLIARTNIDRPRVDVAYLAGLGDDAVPTLVSRLDRLDPADRRLLARELARRRAGSGDWRSWNLSRSRAAAVLGEHRADLEAISGR